MQSRRTVLKVLAAAPLVVTFGLVASPFMRFLKPTMKPFGFFDAADLPASQRDVTFALSDFSEQWICIPFQYHEVIQEFNAERKIVHSVPGFVIRLQNHEIVAYSRICPAHGCIINFVHPSHVNCGCGRKNGSLSCCCAANVPNPVLLCPCDNSAFDLANDCRVVQGPAPRPPRKFELDRQNNMISIIGLENRGIIV